jgi:hypothetical protein
MSSINKGGHLDQTASKSRLRETDKVTNTRKHPAQVREPETVPRTHRQYCNGFVKPSVNNSNEAITGRRRMDTGRTSQEPFCGDRQFQLAMLDEVECCTVNSQYRQGFNSGLKNCQQNSGFLSS